jgi:hypothetical protein
MSGRAWLGCGLEGHLHIGDTFTCRRHQDRVRSQEDLNNILDCGDGRNNETDVFPLGHSGAAACQDHGLAGPHDVLDRALHFWSHRHTIGRRWLIASTTFGPSSTTWPMS